ELFRPQEVREQRGSLFDGQLPRWARSGTETGQIDSENGPVGPELAGQPLEVARGHSDSVDENEGVRPASRHSFPAPDEHREITGDETAWSGQRHRVSLPTATGSVRRAEPSSRMIPMAMKPWPERYVSMTRKPATG